MSCLERAPGSDIIFFAFARPWPFKVRTQGDTANLERLALGARIGADKLQAFLEAFLGGLTKMIRGACVALAVRVGG